MVSMHESAKTIGEEDQSQGIEYWRALYGTSGDCGNPHNEQIGRSNEQSDHKGQLQQQLTDYPDYTFCYHNLPNNTPTQ